MRRKEKESEKKRERKREKMQVELRRVAAWLAGTRVMTKTVQASNVH